jgi:predicted peptidase
MPCPSLIKSFYILLLCITQVLSFSALNHLHQQETPERSSSLTVNRRSVLAESSIVAASILSVYNPSASHAVDNNNLQVVTDPNTYSALAYNAIHLQPSTSSNDERKSPLILVLHGAGRNDQDIQSDLANPRGEHAGLIPSLIASGQAPKELLENFSVLAPYSFGKASFYQDSRSKLLSFVDWAIENQGTDALPISFDSQRIILFGFSDGATVAIELLTSRRFAAGVICSYGYSGQALPKRALERLSNIPIWIFHSKDDVIFNVQSTSDRLYEQLHLQSSESPPPPSTHKELIQYSRYDKDPENLPNRVRGHSMGITASRLPQVYEWMLQVTPIA